METLVSIPESKNLFNAITIAEGVDNGPNHVVECWAQASASLKTKSETRPRECKRDVTTMPATTVFGSWKIFGLGPAFWTGVNELGKRG
jgi:hypothetical protein